MGFVLSPDGKTVVYDQHSNAPGAGVIHVLMVYNVQTKAETYNGYPGFDWPVPQDWMPDGRLLISPFGEQKAVSDKGEDIWINYGIVSKDFSSISTGSIHQPGTKPVDDISDPRIDPSGKRIAFAWNSHVWIANLDGTGAKQVTESDGFGVRKNNPAWSPDGQWLAVHHEDGWLSDIYLVPMDGKKHSLDDKYVIRLRDKKGAPLPCGYRITWLKGP